jgi:hypothetical protein
MTAPVTIYNMEGCDSGSSAHVIQLVPTTQISPTNMTANNAPAPYVAAASSSFGGVNSAYAVFSGTSNFWENNGTLNPCWVSLDLGNLNLGTFSIFGVTNRRVLYSYTVEFWTGGGSLTARAPKTWTMQGSNDNSTWTTLDTRSSETGWSAGESRTYVCNAGVTTAYEYYRILITANNGDPSFVIIQALSFVETLPTVAAGELLLVVFEANSAPTTWDAGWTQVAVGQQTPIGFYQSVYAKVATGGETTFTVNTASSQVGAWVSYRITGGSVVTAASFVSGTSGNCDPPTLTLGSAQDTLFIATYGGQSHVATAAPSGLSNLRTAPGGGTGNLSTAELAVSAATTENPGTFTNTSEEWLSTTLAIRAASAATGQPIVFTAT